jgi:hypothetical protein
VKLASKANPASLPVSGFGFPIYNSLKIKLVII